MYIEITWIHFLIGVLIIITFYLLGRLQGKISPEAPPDLIDLYKQSLKNESIDIISLYKGLQDLPNKVLQTIQGSINPQKGKMAELLTYAELRYDYDRIIPLGWPIDFIGIKNSERIDFIEVKSGDYGVLTDEEKHIKNLITNGRVNFRLIKVSEEEIHRFVSSRGEK